MKILFIYTKADELLRQKAQKFREHNAKVSMLSLLEYRLDDDNKSHTFDIDSPLEFLEKYKKLRVTNRIFKRKKLISYLDYYEIIILYKCEKSALFIVDDILDKCYDFFVYLSDKKPKKNLLYKNLYKKARFIIINSYNKEDDFNIGFENKTRIIYDGISIFQEIDKISQEDILKVANVMKLDLNKDIVYVDLNTSIDRQFSIIDELASIDIEKLKNMTFVFHLNSHDLDQRKSIKEKLKDKDFDFLLIEAMMSDKQKALIFKLSNKSIISSNDGIIKSLELSLYSKNHIYLYRETKIDPIYKERNFFIKNFDDFINEEINKKDSIEIDMLKRNREKIFEIFDPENSIQQCIKVIKEV